MAVDLATVLDLADGLRRIDDRRQGLAVPIGPPVPDPFVVALVGPRHSGKSTIARAVHGGHTPADGYIPRWNVRLLDLPGFTRVSDLHKHVAYRRLKRNDVGILYVVQGRGPTDEDEQALESLAADRVLVLENIRDGELLPTRTPVSLLARHGLGITHTVPIVPLLSKATEMSTRDRLLFARCLGYLRHVTLPRGYLDQLELAVGDTLDEVRAAAAVRWRVAKELAARPGIIDRLRALEQTLTLDRFCASVAPYDVALANLLRSLRRTRLLSVRLLKESLHEEATAACDRYNVEAGQRVIIRATPTANRPTAARSAERQAPVDDMQDDLGFGADYAERRLRLLAFLRNMLAQSTELALTDEDVKSLRVLADRVDENKILIALLGRFSSGKSSLINALLSVPVDDRQPTLLPTNVRPETATVNRLHYDPVGKVTVEWLDEVEVRFATATADPGQLRLHVDEIRAFRSWTAGVLNPDDVTFTPLPVPFSLNASEEPDYWQAFDRTWRRLEFPDRPPKFVYASKDPRRPKLDDPDFPGSALIRNMPAPVAQFSPDASRNEVFQAVRADFALALLIDALRIGYDHPLLHHATIVDTPGTDAPIPHHRRIAQTYVRDQRCPVVYCFLGERPGGDEDRRNLKALQEVGIGGSDLSRFFFVITMKARIDEREREAVRAHVRRCLQDLGIVKPALYFVDVVAYPDEAEFQTLKDDLEQYLIDSRTVVFHEWIYHAHATIAEARMRCEGALAAYDEGEAARAARVKRLDEQVTQLAELAAEFGRSTRWGAPWARKRVTEAIAPYADDIDALIRALTERKSFDPIRDRLEKASKELNEEARAVLRKAHDGIVSKVQSEAARIRPGITVSASAPSPDQEPFPTTDVLNAPGKAVWRNIFKRVWQRFRNTEDWDADVPANRERIAKAWRKSRSTGESRAKALIEGSIGQLQAELTRVIASARKEHDTVARPPSPASREALAESHRLAGEWLTRLDALARQTGRKPRRPQPDDRRVAGKVVQ